jgi:D-sedoheptulose 7-phosphate isomerase
MDKSISALLARYPDLAPVADPIAAACSLLVACYRAGGKVLLCGNGGSAADAEHVVGELMKGYRSRRPVPDSLRLELEAAHQSDGTYLANHLQGALPAISLVRHTALLTAIVNDIAGDMIFAQQVYGFGRPGDVLVSISTSGASPNVLHALRVARVMGLATLGFTGRTGGNMASLCDVVVCVPLDNTAEVQERHLAIYHTLCAVIETTLFPES